MPLRQERATGRRRLRRTLAVGMAAVLAGCGSGPTDFDGAAAYELVEEQCAFGPRPPGTPAHDAMLRWLVAELQRSADQVAVQRFTASSSAGEVVLTNVIASFRVEMRERVLLGAHWDTRPVAEKDPDPANRSTPILGANDGASGVAVLLELARMMAERPPSVGVDLVFFDGEDGGDEGGYSDWCLGSAHYAAHMGDYAPGYGVIIDMVGDRDLTIRREPNSWSTNREVVERVWDAARRVGANAFRDELGVAMYDDHVPLILAGIPVALVIDPEYEYWHTLADTPDKCSPESLAQVGRVLVELVY